MKTTKVFIGLFLVFAVANLALSNWIGSAYCFSITIMLFVILDDKKKNAQLTSNLTDAESDARYWKERFDLCNMWSKKDAERIQELSAELEKAKANSYHEVERKRCREKYNRLYKGKKKQVSTEQKSEPKKIEPFRMVVNPKQSAIVQQILFDNGYSWASEHKEILYTYAKYLFLEESITFEDNEEKLKFDERMMLPKLSFKKFMQLYGAKEQPCQINK